MCRNASSKTNVCFLSPAFRFGILNVKSPVVELSFNLYNLYNLYNIQIFISFHSCVFVVAEKIAMVFNSERPSRTPSRRSRGWQRRNW